MNDIGAFKMPVSLTRLTIRECIIPCLLMESLSLDKTIKLVLQIFKNKELQYFSL